MSFLVGELVAHKVNGAREAVSAACECRCVVVSAAQASRIVAAAMQALRVHGYDPSPPYRVVTEGAEWEWCLVLASESLPAGVAESVLGERTAIVVPRAILERRALLARKLRHNTKGSRIMLGDRLLKPWEAVLARNGVRVTRLTSRTLNQVSKVAAAAVYHLDA